MNLSLAAILLSAASLIVTILIAVFKGGMHSGVTAGNFHSAIDALKEDVQGLSQAISVNRDQHFRQHNDFYKEFRELERNVQRIERKLVKYSGDANGGN